MKSLKPHHALACALVLVGALSGCATESSADKMTDEKITANVQARINQHPDVGPPESVQVQTRDHVVYLSGEVSTGLMERTAEDLAQQTPGVTKVIDDIAVTK
jgi:osmotically-inducible protein OsmY